MSVLVKGMEMPKNCASCRLWDTCKYMQDFDDWISIYEAVADGDLVRDKNCPLVEAKEPHGRLIDEDKMIEEIHPFVAFGSVDYAELKQVLRKMNAVIEAEGSST